jgi:hypothetical protein
MYPKRPNSIGTLFDTNFIVVDVFFTYHYLWITDYISVTIGDHGFSIALEMLKCIKTYRSMYPKCQDYDVIIVNVLYCCCLNLLLRDEQ